MSDWKIFPDAVNLDKRWLALEACPPWRRPAMAWSARVDKAAAVAQRFDDNDEDARRDLRRAEKYVGSGEEEERQVNLALLLRRPLLVRGRPGLGKSTLAYHIAWKLGLGRPFRWEIHSNSSLVEGLYQYDAIAHFHQGKDTPVEDHITLGPLGSAMLPTELPACVLVDELDKASYDLPNDLLHVFEEGSFRIPELKHRSVTLSSLDDRKVNIVQGRVRCHHHPVVVITTNDERDFPPAFLRRCVELQLGLPGPDQMRQIVQQWFGGAEGLADLVETFKDQPTDRVLQALFMRQAHGAPLDAIAAGLSSLRGRRP